MRLHGYCTQCRKIKRVRVSNAALARMASQRVVTGLCADCEMDEIEAAQKRHPSRSRLA